MKIQFPYGKTHINYNFEKVNVLTSGIEAYDPGMPEQALVEAMHMIPALNLDDAMEKAKNLTGKNPTITAIPDGVAVIVKENNHGVS